MLKSVRHVVVAVAIAMTVLVVIIAAVVAVVDVVDVRVKNVLCVDGAAAEFRPAVYKNVPKLLLA